MVPMTAARHSSPISHSKPWITAEDRTAVADALASGMVAAGEEERAFERELAALTGHRAGVAASTGAAALHLILRALGVGPGDEVILPTYVCRAVWDAVAATGARGLLCDSGEDWCLSPASAAARASARTRAVVPVHVFGIAAGLTQLAPLGVPLVEDCCQAFGPCGDLRAVIRAPEPAAMVATGAPALGHTGVAAFVSFHATKLLCTGEGGMALTSDENLATRLRALKEGEPAGIAPRWRLPLSDLQAALGLSQLRRLGAMLARRGEIAARYFGALAGLPVRLPDEIRERSLFFRFPLRVQGDFDRLRRAFLEHGVHVRRGVDALLHRELGLSDGDYPIACRLFAETLSLPLYPALTDEEVERVIAACRAVFTRG
jgi:perosamine synthetase